MQPGHGDVILDLTKPQEIRAIEAGIPDAGLAGTPFDRLIFYAGHEVDTSHPNDQSARRPVYVRTSSPFFPIQERNVENVRKSLEATMALRGLKGLIASVTHRKLTAEHILEYINREMRGRE